MPYCAQGGAASVELKSARELPKAATDSPQRASWDSPAVPADYADAYRISGRENALRNVSDNSHQEATSLLSRC